MRKFLVLALFTTAYFVSGSSPILGAQLNDAQISHVLITAGKGEIEAANLVKSKSNDRSIKEFAGMMVTDHGKANEEAAATAKKLGATPADNETSKALFKQSQTNMEKLRALKGDVLEREYAKQAVADHQKVLDTIDSELLPNASSLEMKNLLNKLRPSIVAHLEHAKHINAKK